MKLSREKRKRLKHRIQTKQQFEQAIHERRIAQMQADLAKIAKEQEIKDRATKTYANFMYELGKV
jgi:anti-sigma-K factor RskA